jgi:hypothetical protein
MKVEFQPKNKDPFRIDIYADGMKVASTDEFTTVTSFTQLPENLQEKRMIRSSKIPTKRKSESQDS